MRDLFPIWLWSFAASIVALWAIATPAEAQSGLVGQPVAVCVAPVQPGDTPTGMLRAAGRFDCSTPQTDLGSGDFWVRSTPLAVGGPIALRMGSLWQRQATIWSAYADGHVIAKSFDGHALSRTIQLGAIVEIPLEARRAPLAHLLWRIDGAANLRGIVVGARLATPAQSATANLTLATIYGALGGLCLGLLVYNLALWTAQRHHFQLAYCGMLIALGGYAFSSSGALAWAFPDLSNNMRLRINYVTLAAAAVGAIMFARSFFETRIFRGWLSPLTTAVAVTVMTSAALVVIAAEWQIEFLDKLYAVSFLPITLLSVPVLWQAWHRNSRYFWLFAYGWTLPIMLAIARIAGNLNYIAWSFLLDNSTLGAMAAEALLSSLAIAYRTRLLAVERDEAREQEFIARQLADRDPLTGLLNRRAFLREATGCPDDRQLVIVDIDHFKAVNETLGHDGGDDVIRMVAGLLRQCSPSGTLVARLGGEEFALIPPPGTEISTDRVLSTIRAEQMPFDLRVTVSLGVAFGPLADEGSWKRLYRAADQALYAAKAAGRDRARTTKLVALAA